MDAAVTAIRRAQRHGLVEGTCLSRSLALRRMLAWAGLTTDLRFGGRWHQGRFEAHAWLERGGTPIADTADIGDRFVPFASGGPTASPGRNPAGRPHS